MATYESPRYKELGFYVRGEYRKFSGGFYSTKDLAEIDVLDAMSDVTRNEEVAKEDTEESEVVAEEKPAAKPRKASAK